MNTPDTIYNPDAFLRAPSAGFDGVFDWSWTKGCFGETKITPMDFDGVIERKGNFILFETKKVGVPIPSGQLFTLQAAHRLGCFTIMLIHGKTEPESFEVWYAGTSAKRQFNGIEEARRIVSGWFTYANKNPQNKKVDLTFLTQRITTLETEKEIMQRRIDAAGKHLAMAAAALTGDTE